ncbi:MAG: TolC family protein, partial [Planctomycetota bacterium]
MSYRAPLRIVPRLGSVSLALLLGACGGSGGARPAPDEAAVPVAQPPMQTVVGEPVQAAAEPPAPHGLPVDEPHDPLLEGQELLSALLPAAAATAHRFSLTPRDVDQLGKDLQFADLMRPDRAVLWSVGPGPDARWYVFDPARIRLRPVTRHQDQDGMDILRIARSLPATDGSTVTVFSWHLDAEGRPRPLPPQTAAILPGGTSLPLVIADGRHVAFLHRPVPGGRQRLLIAPADGSIPPRDPVPQLGGSMRGLDQLDGDLHFANDADGWYRRRSWDPDSGRVTTVGTGAPTAASSAFLLAAGLRDGELRPLVLRLPERYELDHLLALVAAHNPAVNRNRAIYAAALSDSGTGSGGWPVGYGSYWSGTGEDADSTAHPVVVASLARGLLPMHGKDRAQEELALDRARQVRLRIAHDALAAELNRQQAAVCEAWFQARAADALLAVDEALIDVLARHHRALQEQRRTGTAVSSEVLAAEKALADARRQHDQHQERAAFHRDSIRRLCDLPAMQALPLADEPYRFDQLAEQDPGHQQDLALLNNPRLQAARLHLDESMAQPRTDRLPGQGLPLAYLQDADGTRPYWDRLLQALHLEEEAQASRISQA